MSIEPSSLDALAAAPGADDAFAAVMQEMAHAGQAEAAAAPAPAPAAPSLGLGRLMRRIPVTLTLELGSAKVSLEDVAQMRPDSVVELDVLAGEPLTMKINGVAIGKAEVVVSGENYGLKVLEVSDLDLDSFAP
jgi:flagellar motor switch protein FliN/FliY